MLNVLDLFNDVLKNLEENPHLLWVIIGCVGALVILVVLLIVLNTKKTSQKVEETPAETPVVEPESEIVVEEETPVEAPVNEDQEAPVEETVEEVVVEKKPRKKSSKKKAEVQPEETPVQEPSSEESVIEEEAPEVINEPAEVQEAPAEEPSMEEEKKITKKRVKKNVEETPSEDIPTEEAAVEKKTRVVYGKYEVYSDGTSYYYNLKASNGELLIKSEAYASKESVLAAIDAIKRNVEVGTIAVRQDKHGLFQFVLTAKNHRTLVMSANYATEKRATSASESFKRFAAISPIVEIAEIVESSKEEVKLENIVDKKGGKIGVITSENGYYYILKASNGEVLVRSDFYKTELSAQNALLRFQEAVSGGKFYLEKDKRDNYQFKLFGTSGRIVCVGQIYATKALAIANINSVASFVKLATKIEE